MLFEANLAKSFVINLNLNQREKNIVVKNARATRICYQAKQGAGAQSAGQTTVGRAKAARGRSFYEEERLRRCTLSA